jgi:hypothetical protein
MFLILYIILVIPYTWFLFKKNVSNASYLLAGLGFLLQILAVYFIFQYGVRIDETNATGNLIDVWYWLVAIVLSLAILVTPFFLKNKTKG